MAEKQKQLSPEEKAKLEAEFDAIEQGFKEGKGKDIRTLSDDERKEFLRLREET